MAHFRQNLGQPPSSPWAIAIPNADQMAVLLAVKAGMRVVAFHLVKRGSIEIRRC